ncbi:SNF2 helicase associated domain-containing protein [Hathewaya histolytica]|uniref:SNF2 helicase associated domain-containing protein n=1 Tax=Hathewaya histolytica TaxID=1498 RepID=UPI003B66EB47
MALINTGSIKEYCDIFTYKKGEQYYEEDYVLDVDIQTIEKLNHVSTMVVSSTGYNEYNVSFDVKEDGETIENYKCTCAHFNKKPIVCKHVVAAYLKTINEYTFLKEDILNDLLDLYKKPLRLSKTNKKVLNLEISLKNSYNRESQNSLNLKVGLGKQYVVKNIKDFLKAFYFKQSLEFGKGFILDFESQEFSKEDNKILDFLVEVLEIEESISSNYNIFSANKSLFSGKNLYLLDPQFKRFMALLGDKTFLLELPIGIYENVSFKKDEYIEFCIEKENHIINLYHKNNSVPFPLTRDMEYFFYKGNVCTLNEEKKKFYIPLYKTMIENKGCRLEINEGHKSDFASFVLPKIKVLGDIEVKEELREEFYVEDLRVKLYLDKEHNKIILKLKFNYGEVEIDPFSREEVRDERGILMRNIDEEIKVIDIISSLDFIEYDNTFILEDEEKIVEFLVEGMEKLPEEWELFYSESFKSSKVYNSQSYRCSLRLNKEDMLEFSFDIKGVDKKELIKIFASLKEKKKYYKLDRGDIVLLNENMLKNVADILEYLDVPPEDYDKEVIKLPRFDAFYIEQKLNDVDTYVNKNREFIQLVSSLKEVKDVDYEVPREMENILRKYQVVGFKWFKTLAHYGFGGILADEMGLGKTLQTIAFLTSEKEKGTAFIICPTSLIYNWNEEIRKFSKSLKVLILDGNKKDREEKIKELKNYDVVITSYPLVRRDIDLYKEFIFSYCILDEAQYIKNASSQNAITIKEIKAKGKFALTGTPIENSLSELWSIFDFIMPSYLLTHNRFYAKYEVPISKDKNEDAQNELKNKIKPFILRRLKKDVIRELPPKIYNNALINMNEEQQKLYSSYVEVLKNELEEEIKLNGIEESKFKILGALTRLRQICCDPSVFLETYTGESSKMQYLLELLESAIEEGHNILLFSQFTSVLKNISKELKLLNIKYFYLDGAVNAQERMDLVKGFNRGEADVFLISLKAGGSGLNLTKADIVIHFDPWWNPAVEEQATDRAHRIGQKNTVQVIKLISKGTIEEKIQKLQERKKEIVNGIIGDNNMSENLLSSMKAEDLIQLFS